MLLIETKLTPFRILCLEPTSALACIMSKTPCHSSLKCLHCFINDHVYTYCITRYSHFLWCIELVRSYVILVSWFKLYSSLLEVYKCQTCGRTEEDEKLLSQFSFKLATSKYREKYMKIQSQNQWTDMFGYLSMLLLYYSTFLPLSANVFNLYKLVLYIHAYIMITIIMNTNIKHSHNNYLYK